MQSKIIKVSKPTNKIPLDLWLVTKPIHLRLAENHGWDDKQILRVRGQDAYCSALSSRHDREAVPIKSQKRLAEIPTWMWEFSQGLTSNEEL